VFVEGIDDYTHGVLFSGWTTATNGVSICNPLFCTVTGGKFAYQASVCAVRTVTVWAYDRQSSRWSNGVSVAASCLS
jgi:hypothetical protein